MKYTYDEALKMMTKFIFNSEYCNIETAKQKAKVLVDNLMKTNQIIEIEENKKSS